jgi:hypothetical protein
MTEWQEVAIQMLPELRSEIEEAEIPMALWVELIFYFDEAYEEPKNDDFIRRVYGHADWCLSQDVGETQRSIYQRASLLVSGSTFLPIRRLVMTCRVGSLWKTWWLTSTFSNTVCQMKSLRV